MSVMQILEDIKDVRIQGATAIAKAGINAYLSEPKLETATKLILTRPTEPLLQNSLRILIESKNSKTSGKNILNYIKKSETKIAKFGAGIIKKNMNVFSHCHSSSVMAILKQAKKQKKNFVVYTPEVLPLMQGRRSAEELARAGIKVIIFPDLASEQFLRKCDLFLFGADAYLKKGVVNKTGTSSLCELARLHKIPRYSCGISLKYAKKIKIESRKAKELWDERNKNITVENPAFDFTSKKFLSGVISEFGLLPYKKFIRLSKNNLDNFLK